LFCLVLFIALYFFFWKRKKEKQIWEYGIQIDISKRNYCQLPKLNAFDKNIMKYFEIHKDIKCSDETEVVVVRNGKIEIADYYKVNNIEVNCSISYIHRNGDFNLTYSPSKHLDISTSLELEWDFFKAVCRNERNNVIYDNIHAGISRKPNLNQRTRSSQAGFGMDVMMFGFDSVSHMTFMRKLPKSYAYFTDVLGGMTLNGYNIVGDGTPQALIPMLTGDINYLKMVYSSKTYRYPIKQKEQYN